jgi:hypothetical protein
MIVDDKYILFQLKIFVTTSSIIFWNYLFPAYLFIYSSVSCLKRKKPRKEEK